MIQLTPLQNAAEEFTDALHAYCKARIEADKCHDMDCDDCPVLEAYNMANEDGDPYRSYVETVLLSSGYRNGKKLTKTEIREKVMDKYKDVDMQPEHLENVIRRVTEGLENSEVTIIDK